MAVAGADCVMYEDKGKMKSNGNVSQEVSFEQNLLQENISALQEGEN